MNIYKFEIKMIFKMSVGFIYSEKNYNFIKIFINLDE
jgi:hypothetical protein